MSALSAIHDYLKQHFAGHDTTTLIQQFETAIEAKVEEGVAELKQEIAALRQLVTGGPASTPALAEPEARAPTPAPVTPPPAAPDPVVLPAETQAEIAALPPIAQPDAKVEATTETAK